VRASAAVLRALLCRWWMRGVLFAWVRGRGECIAGEVRRD